MRYLVIPLTSGLLLHHGLLGLSHAQITVDGSLSPRQTLTGPHYAITHDLGQIHGQNLFHSFGVFNVRTGESATFTGPSAIANILGRVTGGSPSSIDGLLRSTIPGANLFLMNPSGAIFGPNAVLDVGGSFHVTTADFIRFADGGVFPANLANQSVLSVAPPSAFGFLAANPASITVLGSQLAVGEGQSISLVGGNVGVAGGSLAAPGGRVAIVSVGGSGEAPFDPATQTPDLAVGDGVRGGDVTLSGASLASLSFAQGGRIVIRGGRLVATDSEAQVINAGPLDGERVGIDVRVAEDVVLDGSRFQTGSFGSGRGGDIHMTARSIAVGGDGGQLGAFSFGPGPGGAIRLSADSISVWSEILSAGLDAGDMGGIEIASRLLAIDGGTVQGRNAEGRGGDILVDVGRLLLTGGGAIQSNAEGGGAGGSLTIRASESVEMSGSKRLNGGELHSGVLVGASGSGPAGRLSLSTPTLVLDGALIGGVTSGSGAGADVAIDVGRALLTAGASITSTTTGPAPGGNVTFTGAESISIIGESAVTTSTDGVGVPGSIAITVPALLLDDFGIIASLGGVEGPARGGDIVIVVDRLTVTGGSPINSGTLGLGPGGTITITARESVFVSGEDREGRPSLISSATAGPGDAGRIIITTPILTMDGGIISTGTSGTGSSGDLTLNVGRLAMTGEADINSSTLSLPGRPAVTGPSGTVTVNATESVSLTGADTSITVLTNTAANAGRIFIVTPDLTVGDGALISGTTAAAGRGGDIVVNAGRVTLTGGGLIDSTAQAAGPGGSVTVIAAQDVTISGRDPRTGRPSRLSSNSQGTGPGGDVVLQAPNILLLDGGALQARSIATGPAGDAGNLTAVAGDSFRSVGGLVTTEAANAEGGNILITAPTLVHLVDSRVTTSVQGGSGRGGNITIDPRFVILDHSEIRADAFGGPGGNIRITADVFLTSDSVLSASSALGVPGTIAIQATITDVSGGLVRLPEAVLQAAALLRASCTARLAGGEASSLTVVGRGALPAEPGTPLASPLPLEGPIPGPSFDDPSARRESLPVIAPWMFTLRCAR